MYVRDVMEAVNKTYAKYVLRMEPEWNLVNGIKLREYLLKNNEGGRKGVKLVSKVNTESFYVRVHTPGQKEDFMSKCVYKNGVKTIDLKLKPLKVSFQFLGA